LGPAATPLCPYATLFRSPWSEANTAMVGPRDWTSAATAEPPQDASHERGTEAAGDTARERGDGGLDRSLSRRAPRCRPGPGGSGDRKSTRLNSSHVKISY